jgi:zinc protease
MQQKKRLLCFAVALSSLAVSAAQAAPAKVAGVSYVKSLGGIDEYRLDSNGLAILLSPDHSTPTVTFNVVYRVGSRNEVTGTTGATHLLEHLMFKGTHTRTTARGNDVKAYLDGVGASFNATTWMDRTNYYALLRKQDLEEYVAIEADRMRNLRLREEDLKAEMTVVRNEYERGKNEPAAVLDEEVTATAYQALPYHHSTIGWKSDIENVPIAKLREFYDTFYWPDNTTVMLVGDFQSDAALQMIKKYYGGYPHAPNAIPTMYTEEPKQSGPRRVIVKRPGELGTVQLAHKVPNGRDADRPALAMLTAILAGGKTSRLYRALVDAGIATEVSAWAPESHDLALHSINVQLAPGATHAQVEAVVLAEMEKIRADGVTAAELERVKRQHLAQEDYKRDGSFGVAGELTEWIAAGDWTLFVTRAGAIAKVTLADVQRVAKAYFDEDNSTTGWFVPVKAAASAQLSLRNPQ